MTELKKLYYIVPAESASIYILLGDDNSIVTFIAYFTLHGSASALLTMIAWSFLPKQYRRPPLLSWLLIFSLAFFIPAIGLVTIVGGLALGLLLPKVLQVDKFIVVAEPRFTPLHAQSNSGSGQADLQRLLSTKSIPSALRMQGVMALKDMPGRVTAGLLRDSLGDSFEDIRLLAYGILDQKEKDITRKIERTLKLLERAGDTRRYRLNRYLAELYWELGYQDLVRGDILALTLERAAYFADAALAHAPEDASLWLLRGRVQLAQDSDGEAYQSLVMARRYGSPATRINPWLAEIAIRRRQYPRARALMAEVEGQASFSVIGKATRYWSSEDA